MSEVADYLKRASERSGFQREFYLEKNMPTIPSNVLAVPLYGDLRSLIATSTYVLKPFKSLHPDKYLIVCSWPGFHGLFPYADEYWYLPDETVNKTLAPGTQDLYNNTDMAVGITKSLLESLNIVTAKELAEFYSNGFTTKYWEKFKGIQRFLPDVPSVTHLSADFKTQMSRRSGPKVIVYPATRLRSWQQGRTIQLPILKTFWNALIERLLAEGFTPVVYQNYFTYDMSRDFADKCLYLVPKSVVDVLAAMRYVNCVLDVHSGISRLATLARCPYLAVTERKSYIEDKDYEFDDLTVPTLPHHYIFSFSTMLMTGSAPDWDTSLLDSLMVRLKDFHSSLKGKELPSTNESTETVSYDTVKDRRARRYGVTFIKTSKAK